ncbi:hypothetical protein AVHY2522_04115 [Acidovorax sp. SUPP2522]|uniref:KGG domain-containing protein n=1 Tax=unclassified Acidovorax TaxID=2684926 RepID=UPI0023490F17|nr:MULTISPECIES: KGG domain-containing protein [unclassified Acidovorax]WCM99734.1 hypothetical protein M5C96_10220 [Acidovorax sp. GBBC 1281]GKT14317.1 hypothetical protein AVHY2522_04115 [Acidovorax sp. SUPP2522]
MANQGNPSGSNRGFAAMDAAKQREISSKGGQAAHQKGTAHQFTSEEARAAGAKSHSSRSSGAAKAGEAASSEGGASGSAPKAKPKTGTGQQQEAGGDSNPKSR